MTTKALASALPALAATLLAAQAQTNQTTATESPPALSSTEQFIQDIKNPVPVAELGRRPSASAMSISTTA